MKIRSEKTAVIPPKTNVVLLAHDPAQITGEILSSEEIGYVVEQFTRHNIRQFTFNKLSHVVFVRILKNEAEGYKTLESFRKAGDEAQGELNKMKISSVTVKGYGTNAAGVLAFVEGCALGSYQFLKYLKEKDKKANSLREIKILDEKVKDHDLNNLRIILEAVSAARDMVNEPVMHLNAVQLSERFEQMAAEAGIKIEVFNKKKIESLKMGGLLAVNRGSIDPPTFTVMEWKPEGHHNQRPIVLVGKGVVYDTGGLNLKTGSYMENMKLDMAGAAMMSSVIYAATNAQLPLHIIALMPATDNRLNGNAYVSGDVITMYDGTTVEVINTDAEGRLILADALSYAKKFDPELVINAATLTGSAMRAIGKYGIVAMQAKAGEQMEALKTSGNRTYERIAEFPFWDEYGELLKSDIADLKNLGPAEAGMITAGKFLEKFTDYPFIHLDIAGPAFAEKRDSYRNTGGTGIGVRLLFDFLKSKIS
jgi:leucyl aminopeptidase